MVPDQPQPDDEICWKVAPQPLGGMPKGFRGRIVQVGTDSGPGNTGLSLERRLLEMGVVEGARIELLHEGFIGRDPIAVRVEDTTILWRKGPDTLKAVQDDARRILDMGSVFSSQGLSKIFALDTEYKAKNISPGGCADMLAASIGVYLLAHGSLPCMVI